MLEAWHLVVKIKVFGACLKRKFFVECRTLLISVVQPRNHDVTVLSGVGANSMYAVFKSGGKQYRVQEGEVVRLEKIEVATGESVDFEEVLLVANGDDLKVGAPVVNGAKVTAEVVGQVRGDKVKIVKFRRRKHSRKQQGHRQWHTDVKITGIQA
jgi:large subunit ribosomal protein L21